MNKINPKKITAVILSGGKGSRLQGSDKGLVMFNQRPMIEHILEQITPLVPHIIINANRNQKIYSQYGYPVISDAMSDFQGPLAGFAIAMSQATTSHILTMPCDGPFISGEYVKRMCQALEQQKVEVAVAHDGERMQPVHALVPVSLLDNLNEYLHSGERATGRWYAQHEVARVDFFDMPEIFQNINTQEQLQNLEQENGASK